MLEWVQVLPSGAPGRLMAMSEEELLQMQLPNGVASNLAEVRCPLRSIRGILMG